MDVTQWYATALGGLVVLYVISFSLLTVFKKIGPGAKFQFKKIGTHVKRQFLKHVYYPQIPKALRGSEKTTRFDLLLTIIFLIGIVCSTTIRVEDTAGLRRRSGVISIINLIPLFGGAHMNFLTNACGIRLDVYRRIHRWLGRVAVVEGLVHVIAGVSLQKPDLHVLSDIAGLTATATMVTLVLSSLSSVRDRFYEIFLKLHLILATTLIATLFIHSKSKRLTATPTLYLLSAICLQILIGGLRFGEVLYRNVKYRTPVGRAVIRSVIFKRDSSRDIPVSDVVHVHIRPSRPWRYRAGQYVYLCIPGLTYTSFAQSHPFYVAWWYQHQGNDYVVLIVQRRRGLTNDLRMHASASDDPSQHSERRVLIEGPYGRELNLESYETVMLIATDIGIAGQIAHVTQLLEGYRSGGIKTQRIRLFWEIDSELHAAWVADMMKDLLNEDRDRILDIKLFVVGFFLSVHTNRGDTAQLGKRINIVYQAMDAENLINSEVENRHPGRIVVSLCTNDEMSDKVRGIVRSKLDTNIHLEELEFRPASSRGRRRGWREMFAVGSKARAAQV
ncbi:hypothetical protein Z517_06461 [Fonsecaea pedrosoi CBS 271.37]|uniref:ferric-chelate reductase (NADPH) n=1 Tax=Fonsecaea pedrosoi CBS 271.37 TaxID=1442368 RepID=A0A0D2DPZ8_9EURO|nr:uncharacterized protein Z517_06461 [Fonsecaea pedrosoi CBS 271.37]KIW79846.1 hypothetical protein Z517_06461 [Fonsecaea pedrosoi CBS 271.37]